MTEITNDKILKAVELLNDSVLKLQKEVVKLSEDITDLNISQREVKNEISKLYEKGLLDDFSSTSSNITIVEGEPIQVKKKSIYNKDKYAFYKQCLLSKSLKVDFNIIRDFYLGDNPSFRMKKGELQYWTMDKEWASIKESKIDIGKQIIHQIQSIYCKINNMKTWDNKTSVHKECRDYIKQLRSDKKNNKKILEQIEQYLVS